MEIVGLEDAVQNREIITRKPEPGDHNQEPGDHNQETGLLIIPRTLVEGHKELWGTRCSWGGG